MIDLAQFHQTFFEESFEGLAVMESNLLELEAGQDSLDLVHGVFRAAHSIKGAAATLGFNAVTEFTNLLETLLDQLRERQRAITPELINLLLESVDRLRTLLRSAQDGQEPPSSTLSQRLEAVLSRTESVPRCWQIVFAPESHLFQTGNDPAWIFKALADMGRLTLHVAGELPAWADFNPDHCTLRWELTLEGDVEEAAIRQAFEWVEDDCRLEVTQREQGAAAPAAAPAAEEDRRSWTGLETTLRVGTDKVDALINIVGELVITQSMLVQLGNGDMDSARLIRLRDGLAQLERHTRELQESVMRIRMVPISACFQRFPRLVHDLSHRLGKQVELRLSGEQTELDKTVMERIGDPLVHLVRNALDHGLEAPADRRSAGKTETGLLELHAYHKGGHIVIEVRDDGKGLNRERILQRAWSRGLLPEGEVPGDEKLYDLVFQPGFSTAEALSDLSGRGVGLDVVRRNIKELGGQVALTSTEGKGTTFSIRLPLTLAIVDGQLVRVGDSTYIIPLVSMIESLRIRPDNVRTLTGQTELYSMIGEYIPIVRLERLFDGQEGGQLGGSMLVVVEGDGCKAGLVVDELEAQQQVVIKSLETNYGRVAGVSGATILGDGTVALILDVPGIIEGLACAA